MKRSIARLSAIVLIGGLLLVVFSSAAAASLTAKRCPGSTGPAYTIGGMTSTKYILSVSSSGVSCATALQMLRRLAVQPVGAKQRKLKAPAGWACYASNVYGTGKATSGTCVKGKLGITWLPRDSVSSGA